jgi:cytidylate kinase
MKRPIIAIDGPAGSGKSTLAKALSKRLGLLYVDSGAMYRAVTFEALRSGLALEDEAALGRLARGMDLRLESGDGGTRVYINGEVFGNEIRTPEVSRLTSQVTANVHAVREALVASQRRMGRKGGVVMEGRDIGTVVFPEADLKIYYEVSVEERTKRRIADFQARGIPFDEASVRADIERRDVEDKGRSWGALKRAPDAVFLSGDGRSVDTLVEEIASSWIQESEQFWAYNLARRIFGSLLHLFCGFEIYNRDYVPRRGPLILVSNHESYMDPVVVGCASPRRPVRFMARDTLWKSKIIGNFNDAVGTFPVKRGGADRQAWKRFSDIVAKGGQVCFFPEGTRSPDGKLQPANPGSGILLHRCRGAVVLPVRVQGTHKVLHRDKGFQGFYKVRIAFGPAIDFSSEWAQEGHRDVYQSMANKAMAAIAAIEVPTSN